MEHPESSHLAGLDAAERLQHEYGPHVSLCLPSMRRRHTTYDLLKSTPQFECREFERVWTDIFDFCAETGNGSSGPSSASEDRVKTVA